MQAKVKRHLRDLRGMLKDPRMAHQHPELRLRIAEIERHAVQLTPKPEPESRPWFMDEDVFVGSPSSGSDYAKGFHNVWAQSTDHTHFFHPKEHFTHKENDDD